MMQPPAASTSFGGDSFWLQRLRANFRDQVGIRASLTDSEKMSCLMTYATGKAREVIEKCQS